MSQDFHLDTYICHYQISAVHSNFEYPIIFQRFFHRPIQSQNTMSSFDNATSTAAISSSLQPGVEPTSGNQRAGTVTEPYDQGNAEGRSTKIIMLIEFTCQGRMVQHQIMHRN